MGQPESSSLAFGVGHELTRDASPPVLRMDGEPADMEAAVFIVPEHGADDCRAVLDDGAAATTEMLGNRGGGLVQGAGRRRCGS